MTPQEFDNTSFSYGDKVEYEGEVYFIKGYDKELRMIGLVKDLRSDTVEKWVHCDNVKFIPG